MEEYPNNSHKHKQNKKNEAVKVEKVITGTTVKKKKSEIRKLSDVFLAQDVADVKSYVIMDVLIPSAKRAISDIVSNGIDMFLYGGKNPNRSRSRQGRASYYSYYDEPDHRREEPERRKRRNTYDFDDVEFDSRADAEEVLLEMERLIDVYGLVSVANFYEAAGETIRATDYNFGWTNIDSARVESMCRGSGWIVKLPKAMPID